MNFEPHEALATRDRLSNTDAEQAVLSILINFPASFDDVSDRLKPEHFSEGPLRLIFSELCRQSATGGDCGVVTITDALNGAVSLHEVHTVSINHDHSNRALTRLVDVVIDRYKSRRLYELSAKMAELAFGTNPVQERIDQAQSELSKLDDAAEADDWVDAHQAAIEHLELIDKRESGLIKGIETGLYDLDEMLDGGLQRGNLIILGARPSHGKTALAMTMAMHIAEQHHVGLFSMEMPHADVRDRQTALLGRESISRIKRPAKGLAFDRVVDAVEHSKRLKFYVTDKSGLNILQIRSRARSLKRRRGLDVLMVDYLGLMAGLDSKQPRAYQIEEITRGLKGLAKELDCAVVAMAQVNRTGAESATQIPGLSHLRDSGGIEQDADVVGFVHRHIMANPDAGPEFMNYGLLRIAKNRQGRCGDVHLHYEGEQTRFGSWAGLPPSAKTQPKSGRRDL